MIKKIIACSDLHIRNLRRLDETGEILQKLIDEFQYITNEYDKDEVRIVVAGDLFHSKIEVSNEAEVICGWFLRELNKICKTYVIAGNHDMLQNNNNRLDSITPIFSLSSFDNCHYLDKDLDYQSGCIIDDNIVWCLYSSFDNFSIPDFKMLKIEHKDKTFVGLCHGDVVGSSTDVNYVSDKGISPDVFEDLDFVILGHIHKHQCIKKNGVQAVYCGSPIQQDFGENISNHGFVVWNTEECTYEHHKLKNDKYGFYQFEIKNIDDIDEGNEILINL